MIDNDKRLDEIGNILFEEGAFFNSMTANEKDLFREAMFLMAKKAIGEKHANDNSNTNVEGAVKEAISNFARGFNINVNVNPNNVPETTGCNCDCNCGNCNCCNDQYNGYQGPQGYSTEMYNKDEMVNDGTYQSGPGEEIMYGEDSEVLPKMDYDQDPMEKNDDEPTA